MAGDVKSFLQAIQTVIEGLGSGDSFARVYIGVPDIGNILRAPRFPQAVITDTGGVLDQHNHALWDRTMDVTIFDVSARDHMGEQGTESVLDLGEVLIDALKERSTDSLYLLADSDIQPVYNQSGELIAVAKTYQFHYTIERS